MFNKNLILLITIALISVSFKGDKEAFAIFDDLGKKLDYDKVLKKAEKADIILFGELHNNPINHWLQLELTKDVFEQINEDIVLGAEMYEADDQITINEYLGGKHSYNTFKAEVKIWPNNETDYQPLMDFSLSNQLPFIATNVPRRYANIVYKKGFKGLNGIAEEAKHWIAPLPIKYDPKLPGYVEMVKNAGGHGGEFLPQSQALKDATMAHFILKNFRTGSKFIHFNGAYHSKNFDGIMWYLKQANPDLKILTINCVEQKQLEKLDTENESTAHFIIVTPESMTKTY